jgi:adenosylcobinamide kinase/adenosylcobinamide-phosphate guanylyltransferase
MFTLLIGGAASGKSEYAEALVQRLDGQRIYIATMQPYDQECLHRIIKHQRRREGLGFLTVERYTDLAGAALPEQGNVLLECMSNLLANELYTPEGGGAQQVLRGVRSVLSRSRHLTIVTNEVFSGGAGYSEETLHYLRQLARINRTLAQDADHVVEVVAGLPNLLKGALL